MILALIFLSISALAFVLYPLFAAEGRDDEERPAPDVPASAESDTAIAALKEVEFDHATGKLSAADYEVLRARYTREAIDTMRAAAPGQAEASGADEVELLISRHRQNLRVCPGHGARPEVNAAYCSECGRYLRQACARCGAAVQETGARYCSSCGSALAA